MFKVPNKYRIRKHPQLASKDTDGNNGAFKIPINGVIAYVMASDGLGWEHVSVHIDEDGTDETPTWDEMCIIKDMFWSKEDCVMQYHPPMSHYVNHHLHTLHMWRPTNQEIPIPDPILVGLRKKK